MVILARRVRIEGCGVVGSNNFSRKPKLQYRLKIDEKT